MTGGTGSFGTAFIRTVLARPRRRLDPRLQPGRAQAVRAGERRSATAACAGCSATCATASGCGSATRGVDVIVHAAALKQVPACEYNPFEAVQTNMIGAAERDLGGDRQRRAADDRAQHGQGGQPGQPVRRDQAVRGEDRRPGRRVRAGDGDRASPPCATATSSAAAAASSRSSSSRPRPGALTITDERMTRFWITLEAAVDFVLTSMDARPGRRDLRAEDPEHADHRPRRRRSRPSAELRVVGIRPGEKLHEVLLTEDEARQSVDLGDRYAILPPLPSGGPVARASRGEPVPDGFRYASDNNAVVADHRGTAGDHAKHLSRPPRRRSRRWLGGLASSARRRETGAAHRAGRSTASR